MKPEITQETGLQDKQLGVIDSTFYIVYGFCLFISGNLGDKYSIRLLMGGGLLIVSIVHGCIAFGGLFNITGLWFYVALFAISGIF